MKHMKRIVSIVLALTMVLAMGIGAFAAEQKTITITDANYDSENPIEHKYEAYQILKGDVYGNELKNVVWGSAMKDAGQPVATTVLEELAGLEGKDEIEAFVKKYNNDALPTTGAQKLTGSAGTYSVKVDTGYYLIKDEDGSLAGKDAAYTAYMFKVVKDVTSNAKSGKPEVDKQVEDKNDETGYREEADHYIGEHFKFKLKATIPADADLKEYKSYLVRFVDTMSTGLDFVEINSVTVNGTATDAYTTTPATMTKDSRNWSLTIADVKAIAGEAFGNSAIEIVVEYTAKLNDNAVVSTAGTTT